MTTVDMSYEDMNKKIRDIDTPAEFLDEAVEKYRGNPIMLARLAMHKNISEKALKRICGHLDEMKSKKGTDLDVQDAIHAARHNAEMQLRELKRHERPSGLRR